MYQLKVTKSTAAGAATAALKDLENMHRARTRKITSRASGRSSF